MNSDLIIILSILAGTIALFILSKPRIDVVALMAITVLPFTGVITVNEALAGFANPGVVLIALLFVIGEGLSRTGVARKLGDLLATKAGNSETRLVALLMLAVVTLGSVMSTTAVTAIFIPVCLRLAKKSGFSPRRLLMPLAFAALTSGMGTLIATSSNLVVSNELMRQGHAGFGFFDITPIGIPIMVLAILYMFVARRWLSVGDAKSTVYLQQSSLLEWIDTYDLSGRMFRLRLGKGSSFAGKSVGELSLRSALGINIVAIERKSFFATELLQPTLKRRLMVGDVIFVDAPGLAVVEFVREFGLEQLPLQGAYFSDISQEIGMAELIVPEGSYLAGNTALNSKFRSRTGLTVIGLRRGTRDFVSNLLSEPLEVGDTLLTIGSWYDIGRINPEDSGALVVRLPTEQKEALPVTGRIYHALASLAITIALMASGVVSNVHAALIGCLLMGLSKCIDVTSAYRSIEWKTIILVVGMMPFALALQRTGGIDAAVSILKAVPHGPQPYLLLALLFAATMLLTLLISNAATAILMAPVGVTLANELGLSPYPFAMMVCLAASTAFMTPVASPVNMLVLTPGKFTFRDFFRIGAPFTVVVLIVSTFLVPIFLPF